MALFSRTKKTDVSAPAGDSKKAGVPAVVAMPQAKGDYAFVLRNPRITEKASTAMEGFAYVFDIAPRTNKKQVAAAVQQVYKVKPRKVTVVNVKPKTTRNMRTGKYGKKGGLKKAYVYLQKGETITIF